MGYIRGEKSDVGHAYSKMMNRICPNCGGQLMFDDHFYDAYCIECNYAELNGEDNLEELK